MNLSYHVILQIKNPRLMGMKRLAQSHSQEESARAGPQLCADSRFPVLSMGAAGGSAFDEALQGSTTTCRIEGQDSNPKT